MRGGLSIGGARESPGKGHSVSEESLGTDLQAWEGRGGVRGRKLVLIRDLKWCGWNILLWYKMRKLTFPDTHREGQRLSQIHTAGAQIWTQHSCNVELS